MMKKRVSHYLEFSRGTWRRFREDTPMTLTAKDLEKLRGQSETVSMREVEEVYLPLSRLLNAYVGAAKTLYHVTEQFLGHAMPKVPYIIGVSGSVAVGKSTTSRILQTQLAPLHRASTLPNLVSKTIKSEGKVETLPRF
jgi:type I pantothenate kinase